MISQSSEAMRIVRMARQINESPYAFSGSEIGLLVLDLAALVASLVDRLDETGIDLLPPT